MGWDTYALCECGYYERLPFGDLRHVHKSVCPDCALSTGKWRRVVGREVGSWRSSRLELRDADAPTGARAFEARAADLREALEEAVACLSMWERAPGDINVFPPRCRDALRAGRDLLDGPDSRPHLVEVPASTGGEKQIFPNPNRLAP